MTNLKMTKPNIVFYIFDDFNEFVDCVALKPDISHEAVNNECCEIRKENRPKKFLFVFKINGYFLSVFARLMKLSPIYFRLVTKNFLNNAQYSPGESEISVKFHLVKPKLEILDYAWNYRLCNLILERQELEHAMSWLSTLGGAFSALGDNIENCAKVAGKISLQQFKIAFRLGEPPLIARCKLYMALSLIQLGKLGAAKSLVQEQYYLAKIFNDIKLENMCKGVWAKLQYIYKEKKNNYKIQKF